MKVELLLLQWLMKNKQVIVKYKKIGNKLESQIFDDVLFVPNLSGIRINYKFRILLNFFYKNSSMINLLPNA